MAVLATLYCHGRSSYWKLQLRSAVVKPLCSPYRIEQWCACTVLPRLERSCAKVALARPQPFGCRYLFADRFGSKADRTL